MTSCARITGLFLLFTSVISTSSCGVKGPPLPPVVYVPQTSDYLEPGPITSPTPKASPTALPSAVPSPTGATKKTSKTR